MFWELLVLAAIGTTSLGEHSARVSFRHDVVPILTKIGCNSGACHGTPSGKNGFRLSLRGYDPDLDIQSLTRDMQGRRINRSQPNASLILLKASAQVPHEGGRRLTITDPLFLLLCRWIAEGARDDNATAPPLARLEVQPRRPLVHEPAAAPQLRVCACYADGTTRDVTYLTRFSVNDEAVAQVSGNGMVKVLRKGEAAVAAEYLSQMATATVIYVPPQPTFVWPNPPEHNYIDHYVFSKLRLLQIEPSPLSSDEV